MRESRVQVGCLIFALSGSGLTGSACSDRAPDCDETRTCAVPVGYIDAGNFDDWWDAGAAGDSEAIDSAPPGQAGASEGFAGAAGEAPAAADALAVLGVTPADGAVGVASDAQIVIEFGCAIDTPSFAIAYRSSDLPAAALTFIWNAARTELTLKPKAPLAYNSGAASASGEPAFTAKSYHYGFSGLACADGRALADESLAFSTLREASVELSADAQRTGNWTDGEGEGIHNCLRNAQAPYLPSVCIGDDSSNVRYTGFISFDFSEFPAGISQISSARLLANAMLYGSTAPLGPSLLEHVAFGELDEAALSVPASASLGAFYGAADLTSGTHFELDCDVTSAFASDYADRAAALNLSQYRLGFANLSADYAWDDIELSTSDIHLSATYLVP